MSERTITFSELAAENLLEIGAGRPRSAGLDRYPLPILRVGDVLDGAIESSSLTDYPSDTTRPAMGPKVSRPGDIVLTTKGTVGRVAMMPPEGPVFAYSPQLCYFRPIANGPLIPRYLYYWFKSKEFWDQADALKGQTDMADFISLSDIQSLKMKLPSLEEQKRTVSILGSLDDKIALNEDIVKTIVDLGKSLFVYLFQEALESLTLGSMPPHGWQRIRLEEAISSFETGTRPKGGVGQYAAGIPSIGAESIVSLAKFDYAKLKYVPNDFYVNMKRGKLQSHDILLYKDGGRPGNFEPHVSLFGNGFPFPKMCINEHVYRIRLAPPFTQTFGYFWFDSAPLREEMRRRGTGVAIPGLNSSAVRGLPIVQPPVDRLQKFDLAVSPLIDRALSASKESHTLAEFRDALLPKLMSGEIRVRDAEKAVEDAA